MMWAEIRYQIANFLFFQELEDAYNMGIREGQEAGMKWSATYLQVFSNTAPKSEQAGLAAAIKKLKEVFFERLD
jgi:hypothetical protein